MLAIVQNRWRLEDHAPASICADLLSGLHAGRHQRAGRHHSDGNSVVSYVCGKHGFWVNAHGTLGASFFSFGTNQPQEGKVRPPEWTQLRNHWEYSHVA